MICSHCQTENPDGAESCSQSGRSLRPTSAATVPPAPPSTPRPSNPTVTEKQAAQASLRDVAFGARTSQPLAGQAMDTGGRPRWIEKPFFWMKGALSYGNSG